MLSPLGKTTSSIMGLFILFKASWFHFDRSYISGYLSFLRFSSFVKNKILKYVFMILKFPQDLL